MKSAIRVRGHMFTGDCHADALMAALNSNITTEEKRYLTRAVEEKNVDTGFTEDGYNFLTRSETQAKYGFSTSEDMRRSQ